MPLLRAGADPDAVVRHREAAAAGVVDDAVAQQVAQHPAQQGGVPHDGQGAVRPDPLALDELDGVPLVQAGVQQLADGLAGQFHCVHWLAGDGLESVFQLGGQVEVSDKGGQLLALAAGRSSR